MDLWKNLGAGIRLASFRRVRASDFRFTLDQLVVLAVLLPVFAWLASWLGTAPPRDFDLRAFESLALRLVLTIAFAYFATRFGRGGAMTPLAIVLLSLTPAEELLVAAFDRAALHSDWLASGTPLMVTTWLTWIWFAAVHFRALRLFGLTMVPSQLAVAAYIGALWTVLSTIPSEPFFVTDTWSVEATMPDIDGESVMYAQSQRVEEALAALEPERPGIVDLYLVAFAGDGTQDVFMREARHVQALFDRDFDTAGRSIALINNAETVDANPVASRTNLRRVLGRVGEQMNPSEDVLFLFLTSHGRSDPEFSIHFPPLPLQSIAPGDLAAMLDEAGIGWRVIVISACYSGGFVETLESERTLVMTAAAADRESFGCGSESEFTYFGRALFDEQLRVQRSFEAAFQRARERVHEWESQDALDPSRPQISVGLAIRGVLAKLERRLARAVRTEP